tara:strand:+ start:103 stop:369 length:267 start_codon:yes stop_codon:yes gene_type:complete
MKLTKLKLQEIIKEVIEEDAVDSIKKQIDTLMARKNAAAEKMRIAHSKQGPTDKAKVGSRPSDTHQREVERLGKQIKALRARKQSMGN